MSQLHHLPAIEKRLWSAADTLRANSNYASNQYFLPVMGLLFLRHAYSRFLAVKTQIQANPNRPTRGGQPLPLTKEDFSQKSAIFLQPSAQFDYLVSLPDSADRGRAIADAMQSIEDDYDTLRGILPKNEYQTLDNDVIGQLLRLLNPEELKHTTGDIFGRIYEYFLTRFADQKAHDDGEFFTPVSLVSLIAYILEPKRGIVLDPAAGSGGMFVQSAHFVETLHQNPGEQLTFYGLEKNDLTIRLAKMNLAVHGLEGNIQLARTYYEDPHELIGQADYVMANPPFNMNDVDAEKVKGDPRLPFGLPGVNKSGKVSNGNYLWISYFYSYLNETGRAGFVMSSQASSAGRDEATVRQQLIQTGAVDIMIAIRSNFFYTRTVPCELWFLNRAKPAAHHDKVLMLDARNIYRKVTRKIYDFSPEQLHNILAIIWLYRGQTHRFLDLVTTYLVQTLASAHSAHDPLTTYRQALDALLHRLQPFAVSLTAASDPLTLWEELTATHATFTADTAAFQAATTQAQASHHTIPPDNTALHAARDALAPLATTARDLIKQADHLYKLASRFVDTCENDLDARNHPLWPNRDITNGRKTADQARQDAVESLKQIRYHHHQAVWLTERFPAAELCDVPGLVKLVDHAALQANDWSLTPGRYVGVAPEEIDEDFDFEEALRDIHIELSGLNEEAALLAVEIARNFEELF